MARACFLCYRCGTYMQALPGQPVDPEDAQSYFRTGRFHSGLPVSASDAQSYFTTGELPDPSTQNRQLGVSREQPGFVGCGPFAPAPAPNSPATFARKHTSLSRPGGTRGSLPASPAASHQAVPTKPLPKTSQPKPQTIRTSPESEAQLSAYSVVFGDISTSYRRTDPTTTTDAKSHLLGRFPMRSLPPVRSSVSGNASPIPSHSTAAKSTALKPHRQMEQGPKVAGLSGSAVESSQLKVSIAKSPSLDQLSHAQFSCSQQLCQTFPQKN